MKKLFLGFLFRLSMFSQGTFVKKFTSMILKIDGVLQSWEKISLIVVFHPKKERDIGFYCSRRKQMTFHQISGATEDKKVLIK